MIQLIRGSTPGERDDSKPRSKREIVIQATRDNAASGSKAPIRSKQRRKLSIGHCGELTFIPRAGGGVNNDFSAGQRRNATRPKLIGFQSGNYK